MDTHFFFAHSIYVIVMLAGCITFLVLARNPLNIPKIDYLIAAIIPLWSGLAYLSVLLGQGVIEFSGRSVYLGRYIDWIVTTPLLLLSLCFTAMYSKKKNVPLIIGIITIDIIMIVCGAVADLSVGTTKLIWFGIGVVAFIIVFYVVWFPLRSIAKSHSDGLYKLYIGLSIYITVLWIGYPTSWILGPSGYDILNPTLELYAFIILPIFSKVGFSLFDLIGLRRLSQRW